MVVISRVPANLTGLAITLEELGLPYTTHKINFSSSDQKSEEFLKINPNGRIPAITDTFTDGKLIRVFESGSIMEYLVNRYDQPEHKISYPKGSREDVEVERPPSFSIFAPARGDADAWTVKVTNWMFFMNSGKRR